MNLDLLLKPSLKNFFISLLIWYLCIIAYGLIGSANYSLLNLLLFYTKYSWPNFLLIYSLVIWVIPIYISSKQYIKLFTVSMICIFLYALVRYLNNTYWSDDYYQIYINDVLYKQNKWEITWSEFFRGLTFAFIAFAYRMFFDWMITDRRKSELEKEKLVADLALLRYQLNPHFLFNTINDIYYLALIKSDKTAEALLKLSDLLRYVLHEKADMVPLEKEIKYLKEFVELHHFRFPDDVVVINLDTENLTSDLYIPPLLLSTFIENAFKHGQPGTYENPVLINVEIKNKILSYTVINPLNTPISKDETSGIGLPNLEKRLKLLFPDKHSLSFSQYNKNYISHLELQLN